MKIISQFLEFALCIYHCQGARYIQFLPYIASYMQLFSKAKANYFKAILYQYAHLKYCQEINHPALPVLYEHFAAFNEEKGEKSIHEAFRNLRDSDFSYDNMDYHYRMLPLMKSVTSNFNISRTHKSASDGYKYCNLDIRINITPSDNRNRVIYNTFCSIIGDINENKYSPYVEQKNLYEEESPKVENYIENEDQELNAIILKLAELHAPQNEMLLELPKKMTENFTCDLFGINVGEY